MNDFVCLIAEGEAVTPPQQGMAQQNPMGMLIPFILIFFVMYFLVIRPSSKQRREQMQMLTKLERNDRVVTSAGIVGHVVSLKEGEDEVTLKTGDQEPATRITILRSTIVRVFKPGETAGVEKKA